jgi:hypothetical protein
LKVTHCTVLWLCCSNGRYFRSSRVWVVASVASFALLPHSHLAGSVIVAVLSTWRKARTMLALKKTHL